MPRQSPRHAIARAVIALGVSMSLSCGGGRSGTDQRQPAHMWTPSEAGLTLNVPRREVSAVIRAKMADRPPAPLTDRTWNHARRLYRNYENAPLWLIGDGLDKSRVGALMLALADVSSDGLRLEDYPLAALDSALDSLSTAKEPTPEALANVDVMLTAAYVTLGVDLMTGQIDPTTVYQSWHISRKEQEVDSALFRSIRAEKLDQAMALMRPRDEGYDSLRVQLAKYRAAAAKGWTTVPAGKILRLGAADSVKRLVALKSRLIEEGYLSDSMPLTIRQSDTGRGKSVTKTRQAVYTGAISAAVAKFQAHHGIPVDGSLGVETLNAMNLPADYRAAQIATNLERYRWMPRALGVRYIMVNVPAFKVVAYDSGRQVLEMKVIVGEEYRGKATPVFADTMLYVVFRPYWNVTPNIQTKEFAPKIAADSTFLQRGGYEYYMDHGVQRIRQKPGSKNELGLVKFLFPNDFNIYLHDTPNGQLFNKDVRGFSHGCIRLEHPDEMAEFVLGWDSVAVHAAMNSGPDNRSVTVPHPIPVFITYFTAFVTDGQLYFGNDLYKRDEGLVYLMAAGALPSDDALRAAQALRAMAEKWGVSEPTPQH